MAQLEIGLNERELKRHGVLERLKSGAISQVPAAQELGLSAPGGAGRMEELRIRVTTFQ